MKQKVITIYLGYVSYVKVNMYDNNSTKDNRKEIELYHCKNIALYVR